MRLDLSDTSGKDGILQIIETQLGFPDGYITADATRIKKFTSLINESISSALDIIFDVAYGWNPDDVNHTDYPIQFFNLVSGQREYSFTNDEDGNEILEILKVAVKDSSGVFKEIPTVDQQARQSGNNDVDDFIDGQNGGGVPTRYDKTATGIFFDPIPNYNSTNGAKIFIQRAGLNLTAPTVASPDSTSKPGFSGAYHYWCVWEPCFKYAIANTLEKKIPIFEKELLKMEQKIRKGYGRRDRDMFKRLQTDYSGANSSR